VIIGRTFGWVLVILAIIMASGEAVMALGTGAYTGLATSDIWTLLVGQSPEFANQTQSNQLLAAAGAGIMDMPAWLVMGVIGFTFAHVCRKRRARRRVFYKAA
jgi:hypothetical protein